MAKKPSTPTAPQPEVDLLQWLWSCFEGLFEIDYLAPFEALLLATCYVYLIYYTALNLLSKNKYYINLSHNLAKWIALGLLSISHIVFNRLFKFVFLSRLTVMVLSALVVYPSKNVQKVHLSLAIRNKDKMYERLRTDPSQSGVIFSQRLLISLSDWLLSLTGVMVKLIHPDNRTASICEKVNGLYETIKGRRYFLELSDSRKDITENVSEMPGVNNLVTSKLVSRESNRQQKKGPDYGLPAFMTQSSFVNPPAPAQSNQQAPSSGEPQISFLECVQVIQITKKKYEYFRDVKVRYMPATNQIEILYLQQNNRLEASELQEVRVMNDQTLEFVLEGKSKFIQFKGNTEMKAFLRPIIDGGD